MTDSDVSIARATGFSECAIALRRALTTTPAGWLLAVWFCWDRVPSTAIFLWLGTAAALWGGSLLVLQQMIARGPKLELHRKRFHWIAGLDGLAWGLLTWFLIGHDPVLDAVLMALLCGVTSINAQVYGTYVSAYFGQIGVLWGVSVLGLMLVTGSQSAIDYAAGLSLFIALTAYYTRAISRRLLEGIRLLHANASLASQLRSALQKVELDAATDALTGQWNRRALDDFLKHQKTFSILMLDIDFFKRINDEFGHLVGDDVLRAFAQRLREFLRSGDFCARFGGEEFIVVLPETTLATAQEVAERIRKGVAELPLLHKPKVQATVSIGVATMAQGQSINALFAAADAAVYLAKNAGRNQVRSHVETVLPLQVSAV
ncbi:sensor domain-containing diguanylate cyclase [Massilia aerilata]|uniref:diguanylate cyclase n=1 Tax=Massilia aerilata TaxID=453817 RepID=A0ABW0S4P6_9BURK